MIVGRRWVESRWHSYSDWSVELRCSDDDIAKTCIQLFSRDSKSLSLILWHKNAIKTFRAQTMKHGNSYAITKHALYKMKCECLKNY